MFRHPNAGDLEDMQVCYGEDLSDQYFKHIEEVCPPKEDKWEKTS